MSPGVYVHIPFCRSRCSYCDFATDVFRSADAVERYVAGLCREISGFEASRSRVDTIYFGGGTPSLLSPRQLETILAEISAKFAVQPDAEVTLEMNPATMTLATARAYRSLGVNRASFGAQTFNDSELRRLGRRHTAKDVRDTIDLLRTAGFTNVSFDLIAGLPRQTIGDWERNLDEAIALRPEHLSLYLLEIHEGTPLAEQIRSRRQPLPDDDLAAEMYALMTEKTAKAGLGQYEISNFARRGFESRHNSKYWRLEPVFGFGVSAHSFDGRARYSNERDTNRYVAAVESGHSPETTRDAADLESEYLILGLRMIEGIDLGDYARRFGSDLPVTRPEAIDRLSSAGLAEIANGRLRLTERGRLFSNDVFVEFL